MMRKMLRKLFITGLFVLGVVCFFEGMPSARAQIQIEGATQKSPNFQISVIKEAYPFPGVYCSVERPTKSFEESAYVAFDMSLMTVAQIRGCMNKIPKGFVLKEEYTLPLFADDLRQSQAGYIACEFVQPSGTLSRRYKITFVLTSLIKDQDIKKCFEDALDKPNVFKPMVGGRGYSL